MSISFVIITLLEIIMQETQLCIDNFMQQFMYM